MTIDTSDEAVERMANWLVTCGEVPFQEELDAAALLRALADERRRLREGISKALLEIEDAGPKALKYAAQELRAAMEPRDDR